MVKKSRTTTTLKSLRKRLLKVHVPAHKVNGKRRRSYSYFMSRPDTGLKGEVVKTNKIVGEPKSGQARTMVIRQTNNERFGRLDGQGYGQIRSDASIARSKARAGKKKAKKKANYKRSSTAVQKAAARAGAMAKAK